MAIMAMNAGKHVYLEKPCSHNANEGGMLVAVKNKTGKVSNWKSATLRPYFN
jgi:predicted dehydrogenase